MEEFNSISLKCESCGANLSVKEGREYVFCEHCGAKIYLNAKQEIKQEIRHIDVNETEIKRAFYEAEVEKKRLELEAQEKERKRKAKSILITILAVLILILIIICIVSVESRLFCGGIIVLVGFGLFASCLSD